MIVGSGSVGNYLLDYLMSTGNGNIEIAVFGRNEEKMTSDVNIVWVVKDMQTEMPKGIRKVLWESSEAIYELATASVWVDN